MWVFVVVLHDQKCGEAGGDLDGNVGVSESFTTHWTGETSQFIYGKFKFCIFGNLKIWIFFVVALRDQKCRKPGGGLGGVRTFFSSLISHYSKNYKHFTIPDVFPIIHQNLGFTALRHILAHLSTHVLELMTKVPS